MSTSLDHGAESGKLNSFSAKLEEIFGMDLRSLALFRIGLALVILGDLFIRSSDIRVFYTDFGLLPRAPLIEKFLDPRFISFHLMNGAAWFQWVLFVAAAFFGIGMLFGYRTRLMTFLSWVFLVSIHNRNPIILQGGDVYIRVLLFWAMFVPLGARYSIDAALDTSDKKLPNHFYSIGTAALSLQVALIYIYSAGYKWKGADWQNGSAVYYALSLDSFRTPIGDIFLRFPRMLTALTHYVLRMEILTPLIIFCPIFFGPLRTAGIVSIVSLHMGLNACMELGPFPYIGTVATFCILPTWFWGKLMGCIKNSFGSDTTIYYDGDCGFCKKSVYLLRTFLLLPNATVAMAQSEEGIHEEMKKHNSWIVKDNQNKQHHAFGAFVALCQASVAFWWFVPVFKLGFVRTVGGKIYRFVADQRSFFGSALSALQFRPLSITPSGWMGAWAAFSLLSVFLWNHTSLYKTNFLGPQFIRSYCLYLRLDQSWSMFAPTPNKNSGWYVIDGNLKSGKNVDIFSKRSPVNWERPKRIEKMVPNERWRKYLANFHLNTNLKYRLYYGQYLCREWNSTHTGDDQLNDFNIVFMHEINGPDNTSTPVKPLHLWKHYCFEVPGKN